MCIQEIVIHGNSPVVKIGYSNIKENVNNEGKIEEGEVKAIHLFSHPVLHCNLDSEKPEWLYQKVQQDE